MELDRPFAQTGEREDYDTTASPTGDLSQEKGFTELFQLKPEEGGLFILRKKFNQILYLISDQVLKNKQAIADFELDINSLPNKVTPADTDNLALQETGGLLKKLSFANLKLWILSLFNPTLTGTVSFSSTTNNIRLTNIVTALGLEIGDVIQISGATDAKNNSEFTVEVITDDDNIIINQAHANKGTSKNVATRSGDTEVTVKLLAKWYNAELGLGQDWVDVTSNRSSEITYPTPLNRSIAISATIIKLPASLYSLKISNNDSNVGYIYNTIPSDNHLNMYIHITKGYYKVSVSLGSAIIAAWSELR